MEVLTDVNLFQTIAQFIPYYSDTLSVLPIINSTFNDMIWSNLDVFISLLLSDSTHSCLRALYKLLIYRYHVVKNDQTFNAFVSLLPKANQSKIQKLFSRAIEFKDFPICVHFIQSDVDIEHTCLDCITYDNIELLTYLLKRKDVSENTSLLLRCIQKAYINCLIHMAELINPFIKKYPYVSSLQYYCFFVAARSDHKHVMEYILETYPLIKNDMYKSPCKLLSSLAQNGHEEMFISLYPYGKVSESTSSSLVLSAYMYNRVKILDYMIDTVEIQPHLLLKKIVTTHKIYPHLIEKILPLCDLVHVYRNLKVATTARTKLVVQCMISFVAKHIDLDLLYECALAAFDSKNNAIIELYLDNELISVHLIPMFRGKKDLLEKYITMFSDVGDYKILDTVINFAMFNMNHVLIECIMSHTQKRSAPLPKNVSKSMVVMLDHVQFLSGDEKSWIDKLFMYVCEIDNQHLIKYILDRQDLCKYINFDSKIDRMVSLKKSETLMDIYQHLYPDVKRRKISKHCKRMLH